MPFRRGPRPGCWPILGNPFDLDAVTAFCREHQLWLIEDNCDANGSVYRGRKTGTLGDAATLRSLSHHYDNGRRGGVLTAGCIRSSKVFGIGGETAGVSQ